MGFLAHIPRNIGVSMLFRLSSGTLATFMNRQWAYVHGDGAEPFQFIASPYHGKLAFNPYIMERPSSVYIILLSDTAMDPIFRQYLTANCLALIGYGYADFRPTSKGISRTHAVRRELAG